MYEQHDLEQYFFDDAAIARLADFVAARFQKPCCLCCPLLSEELARRNVAVRILDVDRRFADVRGFQLYDVFRPAWLDETFDIIICDPPFFKVSLSQLFRAVRTLSHHDFAQPLLLCYLSRRAANVRGTFAPFGIEPTGFFPTYRTVQKLARNEIEFFSNAPDALTQLR